MSFVSRLAGVWNRLTQAAQVGVRRVINFGRTDAGVRVDADSALKTATVWACVQYLSRQIAQLSWRVYREAPDGGLTPAPTQPADWLLHKRPNREMGSFTFRQTMMGWAVRWGNAYAEIERDNRGAAYALWPLHPTRVKPMRDQAGVLFYRVWNPDTSYVDMDAADVLHIRGFGDGEIGVNVIEYASQSIGWAQATEIFGSSFFAQGMNPSGIVEVQKALSPEAMKLLRKDLGEIYKGPKGERTAILDAGMKFNKVATAPNDAQFIETRQHQVEEICRWFGVPPHKVMHLLRSTFGNIEQQSIEVVVDSLTPWVKIWEEEADYKLFGVQNRMGFCTKMNLKSLLRGDSAARAQFYKNLWGIGGITINGILRGEDENPIGPAGDVRFVPVNYTTLDRAIAGPTQPPVPLVADPLAEEKTEGEA